MKKSSLVVSDWTENLSSLGSSSSSTDDDDEEEEILPTQTTTPSQTPEKHTRKRLSVKAGDMSSPPLPELKEERTTKIISVQFFSETDEEEGEKERENVSTTTKEEEDEEEEKCFETLVREEVERQRSKKEHLTVSLFEEERGRRNCCYHVIPVTSRECLIECPLAYGNQAQADFEARLVERFSRRKNKMKLQESKIYF